MSIELKVGNWYRNKIGEIVNIVGLVHHALVNPDYVDSNGRLYRKTGEAERGRSYDLVQEINSEVSVFQEPLTEATLTPWISEIVYTNEHTSTNIELPMTDDQIKATVEDILVNRSGVQTVRVYKLVNTVSRKTSITWE